MRELSRRERDRRVVDVIERADVDEPRAERLGRGRIYELAGERDERLAAVACSFAGGVVAATA
jgi:hypothetical protein